MKWLSWISGIVVLTIAALSFVLSFHALSVLGVQSKAFPPELAWIFPLILIGICLFKDFYRAGGPAEFEMTVSSSWPSQRGCCLRVIQRLWCTPNA